MEFYRALYPILTVAAEIMIIFTAYVAIRTDSVFMRAVAFIVSATVFIFLKTALEFGANLAESSREFLKLSNGHNLPEEDKLMMAASRALTIVVGNTFTITKETFPTISQDIILDQLITLLVS